MTRHPVIRALPVLLGVLAVLPLVVAAPRADAPIGDSSFRSALDDVLDQNVRDGMVYYGKLKGARRTLDSYVAALATSSLDGATRDEQIAFWLNAYNAFVLRTVIDHYPVRPVTEDLPSDSIRQIPGAFDRLPHRVAGRSVTLDEIEQKILTPFHDPRVYLALGRGAIGGGRLRAEAFSPERIQAQLEEVEEECTNRWQCFQLNRRLGTLRVSAIFSWRRGEFVAAYANRLEGFAKRTPIERAVLVFVNERLVDTERDFLVADRFNFGYVPFDWALNDWTSRRGRQLRGK